MSEALTRVGKSAFRDELETLINKHSIDNDLETPDHILADHVIRQLRTLKRTVSTRERWHGRKTITGRALDCLAEGKA